MCKMYSIKYRDVEWIKICDRGGKSMNLKISVVLADANVSSRETLQAVLQESGICNVVGCVGTGLDALHVIQKCRPQILITELMLPELDGIGLLERLHEERCSPKTIILSQWTGEDMIEQALRHGASCFLPKPVDTTSLLRRIREVFWHQDPQAGLHSPDAQDITERILLALGMSPRNAGTRIAKGLVMWVLENSERQPSLYKVLYPVCVERGWAGSVAGAEHALRYAIEQAWSNGSGERAACQRALFGNIISADRGKPTNGEFLTVVTNRVQMELQENQQNDLRDRAAD